MVELIPFKATMIGEVAQVDQFAFLVALDQSGHRQAKGFWTLPPMCLHRLHEGQDLPCDLRLYGGFGFLIERNSQRWRRRNIPWIGPCDGTKSSQSHAEHQCDENTHTWSQ